MPRPKKPGAPEPKRRSRNGCWQFSPITASMTDESRNCKGKKVKCGEEKPSCLNCQRANEKCDYSIKLNWERGNRGKRKASEEPPSSAPSMQTTFSIHQMQAPTSSPARPSTSGGGSSTSGLLDPDAALGQLSGFSHDHASSGSSFRGGSSSPRTMSPALGAQNFPLNQSLTPAMSVFQSGYTQARHTATDSEQGGFGEDSTSKRLRFSPRGDDLGPRFKTIEFNGPAASGNVSVPPSVTSHPLSQNSYDQNGGSGSSQQQSGALLPPTPAASATSDDAFAMPAPRKPSNMYGEDDLRRMSVNSLLNAEEQAARENPFQRPDVQTVTFGIDRGLPDYDIPSNLDAQALSPATPNSPASQKSFPGMGADDSGEFGFGLHGLSTLSEEDKTSIEVAIPRTLLPLPPRLKQNPMNLLYFNHFINHVSRILVPHDCSQNPFRTILPQMAVRDDNLLCLLLAYSASHRARLLGYKEPATRIAMWVENVFPHLRHALDNPETAISSSTIATAIMLASREIIAPGSFGIEIPWQAHLDLARRIIAARGAPGSLAGGKKDRVSYFLMRWFAYLDIVSTLMSGREAARYRRPSEDISSQDRSERASPEISASSLSDGNGSGSETLALYTPEYFAPDESHFRIDCLLGFTTRLVSLLARVARLCRRCDTSPGRYEASGQQHNPAWRPDAATVRSALKLKQDIVSAKSGFFEGCPDGGCADDYDPAAAAERDLHAAELRAANQAFHAAALVHLNRRVLGLAQDGAEVQALVKEIVGVLRSLRKGGTAETGFLFPMFTAGVEVVDPADRRFVLERVKGVEGSGMVQVTRARRLMEMVWLSGQPWDTLVQGEFFG